MNERIVARGDIEREIDRLEDELVEAQALEAEYASMVDWLPNELEDYRRQLEELGPEIGND